MRHLLITLILLFSLGLNTASAAVVSRIAAVVNKDIITTLQLDSKLQEQLAKQNQRPSPAQVGALRQELLSRMIEETLVQQRIKALNLRVSEEEIETALLDVQRKNKLTREELEEAVLAQGLEFSAYRDNLRQQILRYKLIGKEVRSEVDVPEREVMDYYKAHADDYRMAPEVSLSALSFPVSEKASEQERNKIKTVASQALSRLQEGAGLDQVATEFYETYGATGNMLGSFVYGDLVPEFVGAIDSVADGGYSQPVEVNNAVHILRVDGRTSGGVRDFEAVRYDIYQMILDQKTDAKIKEWTKALKARAFIDIRL